MDFVIKGLLTNLTPSEKIFLISHPSHVTTIRDNANTASREANRRFAGNGLYNGVGDAFRHCYWSAMLARDIGVENATRFTTAHEAYEANPAQERAMDLHNNSVGVAIGKAHPNANDSVLALFCIDALNEEKLMTSLPETGEAY